MVAKNNLLLEAEKRIERALWDFVNHQASAKVHVFKSDWGNLRAIVGAGRFEGMSIGERQELVWEYLRNHVDEQYRVHLYGVHALDLDEYDEQVHDIPREEIDDRHRR